MTAYICHSVVTDMLQSRHITPVQWSHIDSTIMESFTGLPAYSNCTFSVSALPSQQRGFVSAWTNYTILTAEQGVDNNAEYYGPQFPQAAEF